MMSVIKISVVVLAIAFPSSVILAKTFSFGFIIPIKGTIVKTVFITSGTSYTIPADYASLVFIDTIGAGGKGDAATDQAGGGGACSRITTATLTPGASVTIQVGVAGGSGGAKDTWFDGVNLASSQVGAKGGNDATVSNGTGGSSASGVGTIKFSGGNAGTYAGIRTFGGGGGAASCVNGVGGNGGGSIGTGSAGGGGAGGGSSASNISSGDGAGGNNFLGAGGGSAGGGAGSNGGGGGGASGATSGGNGGDGTIEYTTHGSGGGGGGANSGADGGVGGAYGGGGGRNSNGGPGLIVFRYNT